MRQYGVWARFGWALATVAGLSAPAAADDRPISSPSGFLKAVQDRDGARVTGALDKPGNIYVLSRDDHGQTALHIIAKERDITWLDFLLAKGAPINARDNQGNTALFDAAQMGFVEGEQQLIQVGAQVDLANNRGETPLIAATQARDLASVRLLLAAGADPHQADHVAGLSALDYARRDGRSAAILKVLEEAKPVARKRVAGPMPD